MSIVAISCLLFALLNLSTFPILFKMGYQRGKFWGYILPLSVVGILYFAFMVVQMLPGNEHLLFDLLEFADANKLLVDGGMFLLATIILLVSYFISKHIYNKRDF